MSAKVLHIDLAGPFLLTNNTEARFMLVAAYRGVDPNGKPAPLMPHIALLQTKSGVGSVGIT